MTLAPVIQIFVVDILRARPPLCTLTEELCRAGMQPEARRYSENGYYGLSDKTLETQISENIPLCVCHCVSLYTPLSLCPCCPLALSVPQLHYLLTR